MRQRFTSVAVLVALVLADAALLVVVIGLGKHGWWQFALDVTVAALGVSAISDWWKARRKRAG